MIRQTAEGVKVPVANRSSAVVAEPDRADHGSGGEDPSGRVDPPPLLDEPRGDPDMSADRRIAMLKKVTLFHSCTDKDLKAIAALCTPMKVDAGYVLTTQDGQGVECFVITDGRATVSIDGATVAEIGPGEIVGEMALLDHDPRSATVITSEPTTLLAMSIAEFHKLIDRFPLVDGRIMTDLVRRLRAAEAGPVR
jgi:CRP/FNR family cyclic AMP-dependent transcriptional regulator